MYDVHLNHAPILPHQKAGDAVQGERQRRLDRQEESLVSHSRGGRAPIHDQETDDQVQCNEQVHNTAGGLLHDFSDGRAKHGGRRGSQRVRAELGHGTGLCLPDAPRADRAQHQAN